MILLLLGDASVRVAGRRIVGATGCEQRGGDEQREGEHDRNHPHDVKLSVDWDPGLSLDPGAQVAVPANEMVSCSALPVAASWPVTTKVFWYWPGAVGQNWTSAPQLWPGARLAHVFEGTL